MVTYIVHEIFDMTSLHYLFGHKINDRWRDMIKLKHAYILNNFCFNNLIERFHMVESIGFS